MEFRSAPLQWLDAKLAAGESAIWLPQRQLCVADAQLGRDILKNQHNLYFESSDFFDTRVGTLSPRALQIEMGLKARGLIEASLSEQALSHAVLSLASCTVWPGAASKMLFELFSRIIASPVRSATFRRLLCSIVDRRIFKARQPINVLQRVSDRFRFFMAFSEESRRAKSARGQAPSADLLDVVLQIAPDAPLEQLMEIYLSFVFALVGSVGFTLAWSLLLSADDALENEEPTNIISEALRLFPIAWLLARRPRVQHAVLGHAVTPADRVVVSPYAIHRNPAYWERAGEFVPSRWRGRVDRTAWLPFGTGPHSCIAASLTFRLVETCLRSLRTLRPSIEPIETRPNISAFLAPPRFRVRLIVRPAVC